jgi:lambda family phage tail tape measure protein
MGFAGQQIAQQFASSAVSALDRFAQSVAEGGNAFKSLDQAFLQFAADFLRQIAQMIGQQVIFNLVSGLLKSIGGAAGGAGGLDTSGAGFSTGGFQFHSGGVIGAGGTPRAFNPAWVASAVRYHEGGIAGLRPNEIAAVLERGEEVMTRDDPRHVGNGGGGSNVNLAQTLVLDAESIRNAAYGSRIGEKQFLTFIRANQGSVKSALDL